MGAVKADFSVCIQTFGFSRVVSRYVCKICNYVAVQRELFISKLMHTWCERSVSDFWFIIVWKRKMRKACVGGFSSCEKMVYLLFVHLMYVIRKLNLNFETANLSKWQKMPTNQKEIKRVRSESLKFIPGFLRCNFSFHASPEPWWYLWAAVAARAHKSCTCFSQINLE